ncbi:type II toxin-antitoxin system HicB family antitoxin [Haloarcula sp. JP-L23]|uniref:type II toxin-antitoxin system HicB family antitoxin n=1 Tax=Haloarcula sp. JP-L23 TaxID=2716717 RepID=UPI00140F133C|nr:type II toxin-antitoxin system HicB family antitoxin [Haloarcula sp. JP-L23]
MSSGREVRLLENDDGWWTARDVEAEVSSQGPTNTEALENLEEAVALAAGDIGRLPTDDE